MYKIYKFKPLEWFEKNAYKDFEEDWWESEQDRYDFENNFNALGGDIDSFENKHLIREDYVLPEKSNRLFSTKDILEINNLQKVNEEVFLWGVEEVYTPETHPEYFI